MTHRMRTTALSLLLGAAALLARSAPGEARSGAALSREVEIPWYLFLTPEVITALLVALGVLFLVGAFVASVVYLKLRRGGRWDRAILLWRSRNEEGSRAELADLRLHLSDALAGARSSSMLRTAPAAASSPDCSGGSSDWPPRSTDSCNSSRASRMS